MFGNTDDGQHANFCSAHQDRDSCGGIRFPAPKSWFEDYFFDTHGVTPAQLLADRALELAQRADRGRPPAWHTALFASQHGAAVDPSERQSSQVG